MDINTYYRIKLASEFTDRLLAAANDASMPSGETYIQKMREYDPEGDAEFQLEKTKGDEADKSIFDWLPWYWGNRADRAAKRHDELKRSYTNNYRKRLAELAEYWNLKAKDRASEWYKEKLRKPWLERNDEGLFDDPEYTALLEKSRVFTPTDFSGDYTKYEPVETEGWGWFKRPKFKSDTYGDTESSSSSTSKSSTDTSTGKSKSKSKSSTSTTKKSSYSRYKFNNITYYN